MFLVIHVCYVVVLKVFRDCNMFFVNPRVLRRRPRGFSEPDHVSSNLRVVLCRRQSFSRPDRVSRNPRVLLHRPQRFSGPDHVRRNPRVLRHVADRVSCTSTCIIPTSPKFLTTGPCF